MIYAFGEYELDTRLCELRRDGEPHHVEPQVFDVLAHLVEHRDRLVTREELLDEVWGHRFVSSSTLSTRIKLVRQAVGDDGRAQRVIETVRGRGFRFVAAVQARRPREPDGKPAPITTSAEAAERTAPDAAAVPAQAIRFCTAPDNVGIAYATSGDGPALVKTANWLTHVEFDWDSPVWRPWFTELSRGHRLVRYDARGCGLSDRRVDDISLEAWVRDLEAVVDELGLDRFPLLGISQGGAVAVAYAARYPEKVSRLVLYGAYVRGRRKRAQDPSELEMAETLIQSVRLGWGRENPAFRQLFGTLFLPQGTPEQMRWLTELQRTSTSADNAIRIRTASADIDVSDIAPEVVVPTLVLHATEDAVAPFDEGRRLAALIPDARFVPLESRNHILLGTEPAWARFLTEVGGFLESG